MDAASIEEMNRMRVSLGMKPLPVPGATAADAPEKAETSDGEEPASTVETRQALSYDNYKKAQEADDAKRKRDERAAAIRRAREKAQFHAKLEGEGLGDAEDGAADAKSWLLGQKKRQKKIDKTRKLQQELEEAEAAAAAAVRYTSKDLAGIKVAHDTSAFLDGDEQVLTLKDTTIAENEEEGDELENFNMREQEKLQDRLDLKKKRPGYNPMDDDEDGERGVLSHYDEEIEGKKTKKFTLDGDGALAELGDILKQPPQKKTSKLQSVSLDDVVGDAPPSSDYLDISEIKVKKPKKKKTKQMRQRQVDDDDIAAPESLGQDSAMDVDTKVVKKRKVIDDDILDDEDLQASLAAQRRQALKKRKKMRPEDIARQLKEEGEQDETKDESQSGGLVIGEISEFVAGLSKQDADEENKAKKLKRKSRTPEVDEDERMGGVDNNDEAPSYQDEPPQAPEADHHGEGGIDEEKTVDQGMGAALSLLRERGLVAQSRADETYESFRARQEFLARKKVLEHDLEEQARHQRERDRTSGKMDRMSQREREEWARQENTRRDFQQSRRMAELFSEGYKPNVELKYTDEEGRALDTKEAFKHLSHQFHGKGSGKGKTEKRLKKIEDEKRREANSMFDASQEAGMSRATAQQLKKRREAGVRLA